MIIKETKKEARLKLAGKWPKVIVITLIYLLIVLALQYGANWLFDFTKNIPIANLTLDLVLVAALIPLSFGITATLIDISRDKSVKSTDFINKSILNFSKVWSVTFRIFLKIFIPILICFAILIVFILICAKQFGINENTIQTYQYILAAAYMFIMVIFFVRFLPYAFSFMILADNPEMKSKEIIQKSAKIMKNKKLEYFLLCLSFIGWLFAISVIAFLASIIIPSTFIVEIISNFGVLLLAPYMITSQITYYEDANSENE